MNVNVYVEAVVVIPTGSAPGALLSTAMQLGELLPHPVTLSATGEEVVEPTVKLPFMAPDPELIVPLPSPQEPEQVGAPELLITFPVELTVKLVCPPDITIAEPLLSSLQPTGALGVLD